MGYKKIRPLEYLEVLDRNPKYGGCQTLWTDYPSSVKPRADLILKLQDASDWKERLIAEGLDVTNRTLSHHNKSQRSASDLLKTLAMNETEFDALRAQVKTYFAEDYTTFGYA